MIKKPRMSNSDAPSNPKSPASEDEGRISIRVDSDSWNDDSCFEDGEEVERGSCRKASSDGPQEEGGTEFWSALQGSANIRFIDDSARSSLASESRGASRHPSLGFSGDLHPSSQTPQQQSKVQDFVTVSSGEHQRYSSLTTLSLSDRAPSFHSRTLSPEAEQTTNPNALCLNLPRPPSYARIGPHSATVEQSKKSVGQGSNGAASSCQQPSYVQVSAPAPVLKSCLVEVDANGRRISCSCAVAAVDTRQLTFHQDSYHNNQYKEHVAGVREVPLSNGQFLYYVPKRPELGSMTTNDALDAQSQYSLYMKNDCRYYFQHPLARLFIAYFVIFCNFLIFAEDPVSHSHTESEIPVVGNVFAFVMTKYPPEWEWRMIKVLLWIAATTVGMAIGKHLIHKLILVRLCRLKMFHEEQGSWMIMFLTVIVALYVFSNVYNTCLLLAHPMACTHQITARMGITNSSLMKAAACGTWLGDFITAWMVTDMMLQDNLYPTWAPNIRAFWRQGNTRIFTFWGGSIGMSALVITLIVSDWINWDKLNRDFVATTELSRAYLASFILVMDLLIVMQDWDFPHFTSTLNINLPGMKIKAVKLNFCDCPMNIQRFWRIHITGKWFNYGIIFLVMILDLNMWKNQIFYNPEDYGQYVGPDFKVYTVSDQEILATGNRTLWTYEWRSSLFDPTTNLSFREGDMLMNSRYLGYPLEETRTAFIPSVIGFFMFGLMLYLYGRFPPKEDDTQGGRLKRGGKQQQYRSSWRRERGSFRIQHLVGGGGGCSPTTPLQSGENGVATSRRTIDKCKLQQQIFDHEPTCKHHCGTAL